jgi:hypothetical protein
MRRADGPTSDMSRDVGNPVADVSEGRHDVVSMLVRRSIETCGRRGRFVATRGARRLISDHLWDTNDSCRLQSTEATDASGGIRHAALPEAVAARTGKRGFDTCLVGRRRAREERRLA